jgi:hypothetical protein
MTHDFASSARNANHRSSRALDGPAAPRARSASEDLLNQRGLGNNKNSRCKEISAEQEVIEDFC